MARKTNYRFERLERERRKSEKRQRRQEAKAERAKARKDGEEITALDETEDTAHAGQEAGSGVEVSEEEETR